MHERELRKTIKQVAKMDRNELLKDRTRENKNPQTILVGTWLPKFNAIPSFLKNNFLKNPKLSKIFKQNRTVTYRKNKSLSDYLLKNGIANQQLHSNVTPYGKCKYSKTHHDKLKITKKSKRYCKKQGKKNYLSSTIFQTESLVY